MNLMGITFVHPGWLWALLFLPVVLFFGLKDIERRRKNLENFASSSLWKIIVPEFDPQALRRKFFVLTGAFAFFVIALARPQYGEKEETVSISGVDILVVLDISTSMQVEDVVPNRLRKAKHALKSLAEQLSGDRVGMVAFAGSSYLASPLTTDVSYFLEMLEVMDPSMISTQGTDIGSALETAIRALERGAEDLSTGAQNEQVDFASKVVILVSDGEDLEERALKAAASVKEHGAAFYVLGIGTEKGAPIPIRDRQGVLLSYKKYNGEAVVSRFDSSALQKIAAEGGGQFWSITPEEAEIDALAKKLSGKEGSEIQERRKVIRQERYQIPLFFGILLLFFELWLPARRMKKLVRG